MCSGKDKNDTWEQWTHRQSVYNLQYIEVAKTWSYNQNFILQGLSSPAHAVYMYKIMILLNNFSSETTWPVFTKFHVDPSFEIGFRVYSNGHTPFTVMPIYGRKTTT